MNAPSTTRTCPKCNNSVASDTKFCPNCGSAVSGIFSGGGSAMEGTAVLGVEAVDTLFPILQDATLGDYDIYGELGRGGMAAVYLALDLSLNRKVAIKTMLPDLVSKTGMVDRFKREAQTAAALSHPHIIQIFSVKQTKQLVYFVMKYIEGRSLESVIIERSKLDVDLARVILSQVGGALAFAHRKGVVHRDMKPANIMLEEDGWAIVTDFGIAKVQEAQNLTATGTAIGTPHYMSPEQFHNKAVTGASDQYSLGVVAYEMLTGRKPFDGATYAEIITQHLFEPPPDLRVVRPDIPDNVASTVMRMMAKDAAARFPDLDAAVASLGAATTTQGDRARTQMISLAKGGGERKVRMSVPQSPIPAQRQGAAAAATVVEDRNRRPAPATPAKKPAAAKAPPSKGKSHAMAVIAATLLIAAGGGGMWAYMTGKFSSTPPSNTLQQGSAKGSLLASANPGPQTPPAEQPAEQSAAVVDTSPAAIVTPPPADSIKPTATKTTKKTDTKTTANKTSSGGAKGDGSTKTTGGAKDASTKTTGGAKDASTKTTGGAKDASTKTTGGAKGDGSAKSMTVKPGSEVVVPVKKDEPAPPVTPSKPAFIAGQIKIGSPTDGAVLYIDNQPWGLLKSLSTIDVKAKPDGSLHLQLKAANCTTWDSTVTISAGALTPIGRRPLECK
jgi:serine/threonine-protein kinase